MTRYDLILKLLTTGHLNVPERRGLLPQSLQLSELVAAIKRLLAADAFFPPKARPGESPSGVYEGFILQRLDSGAYRLHWQRPYAWNPFQMAERDSKDFDNVDDAVQEYVRRAWPGNIDGIPIDLAA